MNKEIPKFTYYESFEKFGVLGLSLPCRWLYKMSKQKKHMSGLTTIPFG